MEKLETARKPHILIVDDHRMVAELLSNILNSGGAYEVESASDLAEAKQKIASVDSYDLILLDYNLPDVNGLDAFNAIKAASPSSRVALISGSIQFKALADAVQAGAAGFLPKTFPVKALSQAINLILCGVDFIPADIRYSIESETSSNTDSKIAFTDIERSVLDGIVNGLTNKAIGNRIGRTEVTIKMHVRKICKKLGAANRTQAAMIAKEMMA